MPFYDIAKSSITIIKGDDISNGLQVALATLKDEPKRFICHSSTEKWNREIHNDPAIVFTQFSKDGISSESIIACSIPNIIFVDFDIHLALCGVHATLNFVNKIRDHKKTFIACTTSLPFLSQFEKIANHVISLSVKSSCFADTFDCNSTVLDKKGLTSYPMHRITMKTNGRPIITSLRFDKTDITHINYKEPATEQSVELPFFTSRSENGVAVRDAANKKIRIGGQIVYEPDRDDDLDDSDPDEDLNI